MSIEESLNELEKHIQNNFNKTEIEKQVWDLINHLETVWDILRLASMIRWAPYENEDNAIEIALNITDRAIEKAVESNNREELETIIDELEMSMELDDRANEVKEIVKGLE
jgi:hypothetical protein|tara:strand:- start:100 stop:432 length:333 start_codon:yes stop_codon:yes gene_type:complete